MLFSLSNKLGQGELGEITGLEKELGHPLLAFSGHSLEPAELTGEQLAKIKELESRLNLSLVAVET